MNKIDLRDMRRKNLVHLITERFSGHQAEFAAAAKKNPTQVNHWMSGHRNPNGDTCRDVERELGYPEGWLDQDHTQTYSASNQPLARTDRAPAATNDVATLGQTLAYLAEHLKAMDEATRRKAMLLISDLGTDPDSHATITAMIELSIQSKIRKAA